MGTISGTSKRTVRVILAASTSGLAIAASLGLGAVPAGAATAAPQNSHLNVVHNVKVLPDRGGWNGKHAPDNGGGKIKRAPDHGGWQIKHAPDNGGWRIKHAPDHGGWS